ncbi:MAG: endonuclease [Thermoanaerobaculia bacterium]|nr:endonuclease [Thermoanaerobaculia bacterium]
MSSRSFRQTTSVRAVSALPILPRLVLLLFLLVGSTASSAQVINEFVGNHTGTPDSFEYLEVFGTPSTDYSDLTLVQIAGDLGDDAGVVESIYPVGTTDGDGFWWTGFFVDEFDHSDSYTIFLVEGWSGTVGVDLDTTDDGVLDSTPWTSILDSIAVQDGGGDPNYGADTVLPISFDGEDFSPGGASRIPNGTDTNSVSDWKRNDWEGAGLPGHTGNVGTLEVANTPGSENGASPPATSAAMLHEFVLDHTGSDDHEFIEIWGEAAADYSNSTVIVIDETGVVTRAYALGVTDAQGFWTTGYLTDQLDNDTTTFLLVQDWSGAVSADLDTNDDGTLDTTPWSQIDDSVAVRYGAAELTYSSVTLELDFDGGNTEVGGASRFPNFTDSDGIVDWIRNDFDGAGFLGFPGTLLAGEAENSLNAVNLPHVSTFYRDVDASSDAALRTTLHQAIDDHLRYPYSAGTLDTWDILELADEDPNNSSNILTVYKNSTVAKFGGGQGPYNREHTWPKSYGFPDEGVSSPHTDCHHLMLSDVTYNSERGNLPFGDCTSGCGEYATQANNGHGGVGGSPYPGDSNWRGASAWSTWNHRQGDIARAQLYMDVRYEGGAHSITGAAEPDLVLTDNTGLIVTTNTNTSGTAYMGRLSVLLAWHQADPPDDEERIRNEVVYHFQGNRNPFVDHPEWVECLFEGACGLFLDGFETGDTTGWSSTNP